jgi:CheY-like chemotaxis protein
MRAFVLARADTCPLSEPLPRVRPDVLDSSAPARFAAEAGGEGQASESMLRVVIIEDDPQACQLLNVLLAERENVIVVGVEDRVTAGRARLACADYDLVFLDIELQDGNGFELVPHVRPEARVVFLTGHERHAVRAFEVNALDYILKPITPPRLNEALKRAHDARGAAAGQARRLGRGDCIFLRDGGAAGVMTPVESLGIGR